MKKLILVFLTALIFAAVSCGSSKNDDDKDTKTGDDKTDTSDSGGNPSDSGKTDTGDTGSDSGKTDTGDTGSDSGKTDTSDTSDTDSDKTDPDDPYECSPESLFPCHDSKTGIVWSSISENDMGWESALQYCEDLEEGGETDWRLPTIDELRTLIRNCEITVTGGTCEVSEKEGMLSVVDAEGCFCDFDEEFSGKYSKLGDISKTLWSSSEQSELEEDAWKIDFNTAGIDVYIKNTVYFVRCVRGKKPETGEIEIKECNPASKKTCLDPATNFYWSKMSLAGDWNAAKEYCENFEINDLKGWRLPTIDELRTTVRNCAGTFTGGKCQVSEKENKLSTELEYSEDCKCEKLEGDAADGRYSEFGDKNETLWSSTLTSDDPESAWTVAADDASVYALSIYAPYFYARCIKKK